MCSVTSVHQWIWAGSYVIMYRNQEQKLNPAGHRVYYSWYSKETYLLRNTYKKWWDIFYNRKGIKYVRVKLNLEKTVEFFFNLQKLQKVLK